MGAEPEHGPRRACDRGCHVPNTRAQEREWVRRDVRVQLDPDDDVDIIAVARYSEEWARTEGRERADEVCRAPAWPREQRVAVLCDQESMAFDRLTNARRDVAYAEGQLDRLRERISEEESNDA